MLTVHPRIRARCRVSIRTTRIRPLMGSQLKRRRPFNSQHNRTRTKSASRLVPLAVTWVFRSCAVMLWTLALLGY